MRPHGRFVFWYPFLAAVVGFIVCRAALLEPIFFNIDEAEYAVAAQALPHGLWPGAELVGSTKPPAIVYLYAAIFAVFGESLLAVQCIGLALWIAMLYLTMRIGAGLLPDLPAWLVAVAFFLFANSFGHPRDMQALNVELPGTVCVALGFWLLIRGENKARFCYAGVLLGLASMFRQSFALYLFAFLVFVPQPRRSGALQIVIGVAVPWILLFTAYAGTGRLTAALDSWFRYPFVYAGDTGLAGFVEAAWYNTLDLVKQGFVIWLLLPVGLLVLWKRRAWTILLLLLCAAATIAVGSRFSPHYYIQALPFLALASALAAGVLFVLGPRWSLFMRTALTIGCALALLHFPFWRFWDDLAPPNGLSPETLDGNALEQELAGFAAGQTSSADRIFVWGYCPQIYFHAQRLPAVRDYLCHYVTGYSAATSNPRPYARADAEAMLIADLAQHKPALIFDISAVEFYPYSFHSYPITRYADLTAFIRANYQPVAQVGSTAIYAAQHSSSSN
ncbi:MAG: glycosyltransferase family 39 protein [bacterium]|nr:glycosyltransferase family 39 protein [bacterium]